MGGSDKGKATILAVSIALASVIFAGPKTIAAEEARGSTYVVGEGESLSLIADRVYKDATRWTEIYRANLDRIDNPAIVRVGTILQLPGLEGRDTGAVVETGDALPTTAEGDNALIADQGNASTIASEPLRISLVTGGEFPPFVDETLPGEGMLTEVVRNAFQSIGHEVEVDFLGWKYGLDAMQDGQFAGIFPYRKDEQAGGEFLYSRPLYKVLMRLFVLNDSGLVYNQPSDLHGLTLCRPAGYAIDDLQQMLDEGLIVLKTPRTLETCFNHLVRAQVDAVSVNDIVGKAVLHEVGLAGEVRALDEVTSIASLHLMLSRYDAESETLLYEFDEALKLQKQTGIYKAITSRHLRQFYENLQTAAAATRQKAELRSPSLSATKKESIDVRAPQAAPRGEQDALSGQEITPVNAQSRSSAAIHGNDVVRIMVSEAVEGIEDVAFDIELAKAQTHSTLLTYWTEEGTAKGDEDFLMDRGVVRMKPGETAAVLRTRLIDDQQREDDEDFIVHLAAYPEIAGFDQHDINITIRDND